jgi:DNA-binding NtrC family response regulator
MEEVHMTPTLIVDGDRKYCTGAARALYPHDFMVIPAESGDAALEILDKNPRMFECALVSNDLPGMNGIEFVKLARERGHRLGIVMITEKGRTEMDRQCEGLSVWASIYKDTSAATVAEKLRLALEFASLSPEKEAEIERSIEEEVQQSRFVRSRFQKSGDVT